MARFNLTGVEVNVYNALIRNPGHSSCSLIIKTSYKFYCRYALYCADHDRFLIWVDESQFYDYKKLGINHVVYPDMDDYGIGSRFLPANSWAYNRGSVTMGDNTKTVKVTNQRTGKKTDLWIAMKDNPYRDPSMPEYWEFIDSFK